MHAAWGRIALVILCYAGGGAWSEEATPDAQLAQAQKDQEEANHYMAQGAYERAERLLQRVLQIRETLLGKDHRDVASSLKNLARLYEAQGAYERAEVLCQRALQIFEASLGKNHREVALQLNDLANVYRAQGAYERAEPLYRRALEILEAVLERDDPAVALPLNNLANLHQEQGAYELAEPLYRRALQIFETAFGTAHPYVAYALDGLANLYSAQGAYERAEPLYQRALEIEETILGKNHPDVATSLNNLANLYEVQGAYERAEPLYQRALRIREATQGTHHPHAEISRNNLALLYQEQGAYERARPLHQHALQTLETALGTSHPEVASSLEKFALLHIAQDRLGDALPLLERSLAISEARLRKETLGFSEARLASFLRLIRAQDETFYNLLRERPAEAAVRRLALTVVLLHKGHSVDHIAETSRVLYRHRDKAEREAFQRLRVLRTELAALSLRGPQKLSPSNYQERLQTLESQANHLETELAQRSSVLRARRQLPGPDDVIARVAAALPPDGALIEIIAFAARPLVPPPGMASSKIPRTPVYAALVLLPHGDIRVADLGPADVIDNAVRRLHLDLSHRNTSYLSAAQELYRLVFQPLAPLVGSQRQLFISPDGLLNLLPFAALHDGTRFLTDAYDIVYLTSGKDLLRHDVDTEPSRSVVVFADPTFGAPPSGSFSVERFFSQQRSAASGLSWESLPGTRKEAKAIGKLFPQARLLMGPSASKKALLDVAAPGILHIATHSAYLEESPSPRVYTRGLVSVDLVDGHIPHDPLLRSVLVMAGARPPSAAAGDTASGPMYSLVTALEIAGMNLWGTQLVVLSACHTGQGEIRLGQGVYGLRRAFRVAGAETLVTSLWNVNDDTTHEIMENYYQRLLQGQGRAHALREAMAIVRTRHPHPYYWAPFIVVGNGAPLRGFGPSKRAAPRPTP